CAGAYQPPPDPRVVLRNRVQALVTANSDLVDASSIARTNLWDDDAFAGLIGRLHHDLWRAYSSSEVVTADWNSAIGYSSPHLAKLEAYASGLDARRADGVPPQYVDARDKARRVEVAAEETLARTRQKIADESLGAIFSAALWEASRNR